MARAHKLAAKGLYTTDPNPRVGCLLVKSGEIVGEGFHQYAGGPHAEINALNQAGEAANGATAYVTLEPCSHFGKTPPCSDALIEAGVSRVVVALEDSNPEVSGGGIRRMQDAGIAVQSGLSPQETEMLNPGFLSRMRSKRPFIRLKMAMSVDGRTAMSSGESRWITGADARMDVQRLRARSSAIMTGVGTILADDPSLNVREISGDFKIPVRIVLDPDAKTPASAKLFSIDGEIIMAVATDASIPSEWSERKNVKVIRLDRSSRGLDLQQLMGYLAQLEMNEIHVETGATLAGELVRHQLVDEIVLYMAPVLMGSDARPLLDIQLKEMDEKISLKIKEIRMVGGDLRMTLTAH
ncbi:MAG: bifunctional diaminohydroxyphosphoribosylaminopyrimidine deaminase/5-amino-6-(5-phosphoribosylamino)uracil reductase RibD [Gammaproteobacteria bacterium]|uniref:Riboflavin biosynthesis protein RibD n=1 Tax=Candidatus Thiopontia autotrophica TaxID=2841688 RepID=A0A8J6P161_9GAMM|nr:bifunctional diaminohydroxyphosphoribosylaminopyrimidine deaminase/5-amino-6-(5-phosphoribosylamino)uracil reductase RibD [Candidatus Thiopontia autotrophica]MBL6968640.1 bifunctional diaminohydroxyphosphoribosylaminopyrimidine deaminase/5-amino-6-(5-phosphoribosylamino)uracil reductase RibD [Gammaproteobacteria bacterium]